MKMTSNFGNIRNFTDIFVREFHIKRARMYANPGIIWYIDASFV